MAKGIRRHRIIGLARLGLNKLLDFAKSVTCPVTVLEFPSFWVAAKRASPET
jgi:hypothetical protein